MSPSRDTTKKMLISEQGKDVDEGTPTSRPPASEREARSLKPRSREPPAEREYLLEYYALVRTGKTKYVATTAMLAFFGHRCQEPAQCFKTCSARTRARHLPRAAC